MTIIISILLLLPSVVLAFVCFNIYKEMEKQNSLLQSLQESSENICIVNDEMSKKMENLNYRLSNIEENCSGVSGTSSEEILQLQENIYDLKSLI